MHPEIGPWISFYNLCNAPIFAGQSLQLMDRAGATPADYDVFIAFDTIAAQAREARAKQRG